MRLEDMSFTDYLMAECDLRERHRKERMKEAEFEKYAKENNLFVCSTNVIEQIRAEIEQTAKDYDKFDDYRRVRGLWIALEIIDKYAEQEKLMIIEANVNGYTQGLKDSSKAEPCDKCAMKNSNSNYCKNCMVAEYHGKKVSVPTKFVEQEPCDDAISRENAIIQISWDFPTLELPKIKESLDKLPSVRPQEQTGHWIEYPHNSGIVVCNQCKGIRRDCRVGYTNYCNKCGARMVEEQESEVNK